CARRRLGAKDERSDRVPVRDAPGRREASAREGIREEELLDDPLRVARKAPRHRAVDQRAHVRAPAAEIRDTDVASAEPVQLDGAFAAGNALEMRLDAEARA